MTKSIFQLSLAVASALVPAAAFALSVGGGVPGVVVFSKAADFYNKPHLGVEVQGWLYPVGMKLPAGASVVHGKVGSAEYAMLLTPQRSSQSETSPLGVNENNDLHSDADLQQALSHKLVRIVIETRQGVQLDAELRGADKPIAVDGWVSDSPSPILTVLFIDPTQADDANIPPMAGANATTSRSTLSQNK